MLFKARQLVDYAEPVAAKSLKKGEVYLSVQFADEQMSIPIVETLVFVGKDLDGKDPELLYFQDIESYQQGIRRGSGKSKSAKFQIGREGEIKHIFDYEQALNELMKCSLRRRKSSK